jgi:thiamine-monophosphate kinase
MVGTTSLLSFVWIIVEPHAGRKTVDLTEIELLRAIRKVLSGEAPGVVVPVGDDAAVIDPGRHDGVLTADMLVDGVHFDHAATSAHDLGYKAVAVNVSDVAAMGGSPRYGLACLGLPPATESAWIIELFGGMREAAEDLGLVLVGGDTSRADRTVISITVYGEVAKGRAVTRSGARPGDVLVVTGTLGASAGGLRLSRAPEEQQKEALSTEAGRAVVAVHERPAARVEEGQALAVAGATAMIDVSDGLALDLARMCEESGVGARVRLADVPVAPALAEIAPMIGMDPLDLALHGGEDYELLAAIPERAVAELQGAMRERFRTQLTAIGEVTETGGLVAVRPDGGEEPLEPKGWDHFA